MKNSPFIKIVTLLALLLYVVSIAGISVHSCSCTGHVCASIAYHQHQDLHHDHADCDHHHDGDCHHDACGNEDSHRDHNCCHSNTFRLVISGEDNHGHDIAVSADTFLVEVISTPYCLSFGGDVHSVTSDICRSPHVTDIIHSVCSLRV